MAFYKSPEKSLESFSKQTLNILYSEITTDWSVMFLPCFHFYPSRLRTIDKKELILNTILKTLQATIAFTVCILN